MYAYSYLGVVSVFAVVCKAEKNIDFSFPALFANWVDESFIFEKFIKLNDMKVEGNLVYYMNVWMLIWSIMFTTCSVMVALISLSLMVGVIFDVIVMEYTCGLYIWLWIQFVMSLPMNLWVEFKVYY